MPTGGQRNLTERLQWTKWLTPNKQSTRNLSSPHDQPNFTSRTYDAAARSQRLKRSAQLANNTIPSLVLPNPIDQKEHTPSHTIALSYSSESTEGQSTANYTDSKGLYFMIWVFLFSLFSYPLTRFIRECYKVWFT